MSIMRKLGNLSCFVVLLIVVILPSSKAESFCSWDVTYFAARQFTYEDLDMHIDYNSNIDDVLRHYSKIVNCNNTIEGWKINNAVRTLEKEFNMTVSIRPENQADKCDFYANTSSNVNISIEDGFIIASKSIIGCYDSLPPPWEAYGEVRRIAEVFGADYENELLILHLNIPEQGINIRNLERKLNYDNYKLTPIDVGVTEWFGISNYFPYAEKGSTNLLILINRGNIIGGGSFSSTWEIPMMFFKMESVNSRIEDYLENSLKNTENFYKNANANISYINEQAKNIYLESKKTKDYENGIGNLTKLEEQIGSINVAQLSSGDLEQIKIFMFIQERGLDSPSPNQNKFSNSYFKPMIQEQISINKQLLSSIAEKENEISSSSARTKDKINDYINFLSILEGVESNKKTINYTIKGLWIAAIGLVITGLATIFFSDSSYSSVDSTSHRHTSLLLVALLAGIKLILSILGMIERSQRLLSSFRLMLHQR